MPDANARQWLWRDEYRVLLALSNDAVFHAYVQAALTRARDFEGQPLTPEWEATYLETAEYARRHRRQMRERVMS